MDLRAYEEATDMLTKLDADTIDDQNHQKDHQTDALSRVVVLMEHKYGTRCENAARAVWNIAHFNAIDKKILETIPKLVDTPRFSPSRTRNLSTLHF